MERIGSLHAEHLEQTLLNARVIVLQSKVEHLARMDVILPEGRACSDVIAELRHEERFANLGRTDEQVPVGDVNALVSHALGNRHSGEAHLDEQRDMGMPQIVDTDALYTSSL